MQFRSKGTKKISELPSENIAVEEDTLFDVIHKDRLLEMTSMALPEINEEQKICIILFYLEKKTYHEICLHTGFNLLQVKSFIQNGKRNLRKLIAQKMKEKYG